MTKGEQLEGVLNSTFRQIEDVTDVRQMTNAQLKKLVQKIQVDKDGNVEIYLRLFGELGLEETVLIEGNLEKSQELEGAAKQSASEAGSMDRKTALINDNHTQGCN